MAPFPSNLPRHHTMLATGFRPLEQRGLENATALAANISRQEKVNLQILAIAFSSISVCSAILAFYWFIQMRRSFRHHLIMLLIQSDMFKALWFLIYPIVVFTQGQQADNSTFCQVNGFFVSLGIEASDFAILMIAIHSALYIFRPVAAAGEGGLYPYRHTAYVLWVLLPLLSASLAFINGSDAAYDSVGTYCYLPVRPFWFRLALSWIPRYAIFLLIFGIYAAIYFYVRYKFSNFTKGSQNEPSSARNENQNSMRRVKRYNQPGLPATPPLAKNGLLPESRANSFSEIRAANLSLSTISSEAEACTNSNVSNSLDLALNASSMTYIEPQIINPQDHWREHSRGFSCNNSSCNSASNPSSEATASTSPNDTNRQRHAVARREFQPVEKPNSLRPFPTASTLITRTGSSLRPFFDRPFSQRSASAGSGNPRSVIGLFTALNRPETTPTTLDSDPKLVGDNGQNLAVSEMDRTREKIRKQLRFLFIYPLVYIAMWLVPFISHVMQYSDKFADNPPFALTCASVVFITLQCAVDCWLFSTREQPWRHMPRNEEGTLWGSFMFWRTAHPRTFPGKRAGGPGKSRAEQVAEAKMAYKRREEESETWKRNDMERRRMRAKAENRGMADEFETERNWWDLAFGGTSMSPVLEEGNPFDIDPTKERGERMAENGMSSANMAGENAGRVDS